MSAHHVQYQVRAVEKPKSTLQSAVAMRPPASSQEGEVREPSTPLTNLLMPYAMGKMDVIVPICGPGRAGPG